MLTFRNAFLEMLKYIINVNAVIGAHLMPILRIIYPQVFSEILMKAQS